MTQVDFNLGVPVKGLATHMLSDLHMRLESRSMGVEQTLRMWWKVVAAYQQIGVMLPSAWAKHHKPKITSFDLA